MAVCFSLNEIIILAKAISCLTELTEVEGNWYNTFPVDLNYLGYKICFYELQPSRYNAKRMFC